MPPKRGKNAKRCKVCHGRGWIGKRGRGEKQGWIRVTCVCGAAGTIGRPPLSRAILDAWAEAGSFEVLDEVRRIATTKPPTPKKESA